MECAASFYATIKHICECYFTLVSRFLYSASFTAHCFTVAWPWSPLRGPRGKKQAVGPPSNTLTAASSFNHRRVTQVLWVSLHCIKLVYIFGIVYIFLSYHKYFILYYSCHTSLSLLMILLDLPQLMVLRHSALLDVWGSCCFALQV